MTVPQSHYLFKDCVPLASRVSIAAFDSGTPPISLQSAKSLAALGIPVFPLNDNKRPFANLVIANILGIGQPAEGQGGCKLATTDQASIEKLWTSLPNARIGIRTGKASGLYVLDIDRKNGKDGFASISTNGYDIPHTPFEFTASGGAHYYYSIPRDDHRHWKNDSGILGTGIDRKGDNGYVAWNGADLSQQMAPPPEWMTRDISFERPSARHWLGDPQLAAPSLAEATVCLNSLDPTERDEWFKRATKFKQATASVTTDAAAYFIFDLWSQRGGKYDAHENKRQWDSIRDTEGGWESLRNDALRNGDLTVDQRARMTLGDPLTIATPSSETPQLSIFDQTFSGSLRSSAVSTALVTSIREYLPIAFDTFKQRTVKRHAMPWDNEPAKKYPALWGDVDDAYLQSWFHHLELKPTMEAVRNAATIAAHRNKFNPVTDYLNLLQWDGVSRINDLFVTYFNATNVDFARIVGSKFLISMVARAYNPGCKVDTVVILEGEQGKLKSSALNVLAGDEYFSDGLPDIHHKDAADHLQGLWLVEIGEMAAVKRSDIADVNRFLTTRIDKFRPSYGRHTIESPRTSIFAATTNADVYLKDPTGARRFWPIAVGNIIDLAGLRRDRDQLFAEAVTRYQQGEQHWLNEAEYEIAKRETAERQEETHPWYNIVTKHLEFKNIVYVDDILSNILKITSDRQTKSSEMEVAKIIRTTKQFKRGEDHNRKRCWKRIGAVPIPMPGQ